MTQEEMIQDYIREVEEHDFKVNEHVFSNNSARKIELFINKEGQQKQFLMITFNVDPKHSGQASTDRLGRADIDDLMEYCWLFMRTAIFLKDLERF